MMRHRRPHTLALLLGIGLALGAASCGSRGLRRSRAHPAQGGRPQLVGETVRFLVVDEPPPRASARAESPMRRLMRQQWPTATWGMCAYNPPGTSPLRTATLSAARARQFEQAAERAGVPLVRDGVTRGMQAPNDPLYPTQWGLENPGDAGFGPITSVAGMDIGAPCGWQYLIDHPSADTTPRYALVIDAGIARIPELDGVIGPLPLFAPGRPLGVDFVGHDMHPLVSAASPDAGFSDPMLALSHGTMTASLLAAVTNNDAGIAGALGPSGTPPFRLVAARTLRVDDAKVVGNTTDTICALRYGAVLAAWLREHGQGRLVAVNLSLTSPDAAAASPLHTHYEQALAALDAERVIVIAATGNEDEGATMGECNAGPQYPSTSPSPNVLAVGGADADGSPHYCRNAGLPRVTAPAAHMVASTNLVEGAFATYACMGTSCAAPHATAVAMMVATARPTLTAAELKDLLISTAVPVPDFGGVPSPGIVNVCRALMSPQLPVGLRPVVPEIVPPLQVPPFERTGGPQVPPIRPPIGPEPPAPTP